MRSAKSNTNNSSTFFNRVRKNYTTPSYNTRDFQNSNNHVAPASTNKFSSLFGEEDKNNNKTRNYQFSMLNSNGFNGKTRSQNSSSTDNNPSIDQIPVNQAKSSRPSSLTGGQVMDAAAIDAIAQEAKPGNKRAILVDLPPYLYNIPALASFFEPYGEVAMLQILPQKRMWDADLIDLLGATMCNRLANQSLCAVVEFYSARMAKFIIGILRKRLPILKFRCALLKPSAAIELSNQADNLGLTNAVRVKSKTGKTKAITDGSENSLVSQSSASEDSIEKKQRTRDISDGIASSEESGMDEMSSRGSHNEASTSSPAVAVTTNPTRSGGKPNSLISYSDSDEDSYSSNDKNQAAHRFVTSFNIQLNR